MQYKNKMILLSSLTILFLSNCTNKDPTFADKLQEKGDRIQKIGLQWFEGENFAKEGNNLINAGHEDIKNGNSLLAHGHSKIKNGESLIEKGNLLKTNAEESYKVQSTCLTGLCGKS